MSDEERYRVTHGWSAKSNRDTWDCLLCGAVVANTELHDEWHKAVLQASDPEQRVAPELAPGEAESSPPGQYGEPTRRDD